jgi:hypothetical protein
MVTLAAVLLAATLAAVLPPTMLAAAVLPPTMLAAALLQQVAVRRRQTKARQ